jgi:luciferase family oxidoreductase group 1
MTRLSVLDLCPVPDGQTAGDALRQTLDLARHADAWGFERYWLAEHHNMPGIASAATAVVIAHVAQGTRRIRVGAGGIMLPNHAPLVIAEQFGTLATLFPGRIDLGLGRAPGTDGMTARALRRTLASDVDGFPDDVQELLHWFAEPRPGQPVRACPGAGVDVPVWILGSSTYGAQLAAALGLPYAFASHFAPDDLDRALDLYRQLFRPSARLKKPHVMAGVGVFAADSTREARRLFTSVQQHFIALRRGTPGLLPRPLDGPEALAAVASPAELAGVNRALGCAVVGDRDTVAEGLAAFIARTGADELMITANIHDHAARVASYAHVAAIGEAQGWLATEAALA